MRPVASLCTTATAASLALASVLAAAPQASAAISESNVTNPTVLDNGRSLRVPVNVTSDKAADAAIARNVASTFIGDWAGRLFDDAAINTPSVAPTCRLAATATDPNGATGTATMDIPAGVPVTSVTVPDQARGTKWGVGDVDHITLKMTCTDANRNTQLSDVTLNQDAIAS